MGLLAMMMPPLTGFFGGADSERRFLAERECGSGCFAPRAWLGRAALFEAFSAPFGLRRRTHGRESGRTTKRHTCLQQTKPL